MKILFVTPDLFGSPGGIARVARITCKALSEFTSVERIDVISLHDDRLQKPDRYYLDPQKSSYFPCEGSKFRFIYYLLLLWVRKYDIYFATHVNLNSPLWLISFFNLRKISFVTLVHGIDVWSPLSRLRQKALASSSLILSVSALTKERMVETNNIAPEKVYVLHNCLDPGFELFNNYTIGNTGVTNTQSLLTVSRITKNDQYKGHEQVIKALAHLHSTFPNLQYNIIGEGELADQLKSLAQELKVSCIVHFLGRVTEQQLLEVYSKSNIFVMPSRGEGFGLVYLEAMAAGIPVIASNQDAAVEIVQHGKTGFLIDPDDVLSIAKHIEMLLNNETIRKEMGENGRLLVQKKFSYDSFKDNLLLYLDSIRAKM